MPFGMGKKTKPVKPKKPEAAGHSSPPPPYTSQLPLQVAQPPLYTTQPPPELDSSRPESSRTENGRSGNGESKKTKPESSRTESNKSGSSRSNNTRPGSTKPESSQLGSGSTSSKAIDTSSASLADLEANMRRADNTPVGKTLRSIYEFAIKRWKEAQASEKEDRNAKKEPQETLDLEQRLDGHRNLVAERDYRMYQAQPRNTHASILKTSLDREMASRQTRIESLPRAEREKQEKWAQSQLKENAGNCVAGFGWHRVPGGYRCNGPDGGSHKVTDKLLAEGRGGFLQRNTIALMETGEEKWLGPLYSHAEADRVLERLLAQFMDQRRQQAMNQYYPYPYGPY